MKANEAFFLDLLERAKQFEIPIYQRTYSWTGQECHQLWKDILQIGEDDQILAHFTGSIVYITEGSETVTGTSPPLFVIDGQQRLTTVMLLLEALARNLGDSAPPVDGFSAEEMRRNYLRKQDEKRSCKLLLTQTDEKSFLAIMQQKPLPDSPSCLIQENFAFFEEKVGALKTPKLAALCRGLKKLKIVDIRLHPGQDNPQLIFESMNATGLSLTETDLIRNFILMGLDTEHQKYLYENYWRQMEKGFGQNAYRRDFDNFMRYYLTFKTRGIPKESDVYKMFKRYSCRREVQEAGVEALVADICTCARYYCAMALGREKDNELAQAFQDLIDVQAGPAFPFLLELYGNYEQQRFSKIDFVQAVRLIEAYVFRRAVCGKNWTARHREVFVDLGLAFEKDRCIENIQKSFLDAPGNKRFPDDEEFKNNLIEKHLSSNRRKYCLRHLENHGRKERVPGDYTVEHIMPQNLSETWREELGPNWQQVHEELLHTLGNLTLTGYNPEYSNHSFADKRDMPGGFKKSQVRLNEGLGDLDTWDADSIRRRAEKLAALAVQVWARPAPVPDKR